MAAVEIGLNLLPTGSARHTADWTRLAEDLGFDFVGITDGQMIWRDVYVALTLAAAATKRIKMGPWVTNPTTRHPTVTANAICTLDEISEGRAFLGIGNGDDSVRTIGGDHSKLDTLADAVKLIYRLASGEKVQTDHGTWTLASARGRITIYWAASAGRSMQYGARYTDGVIASAWLTPELLEKTKGLIHKGARDGGKDPSQVEAILHTSVAVDPTNRQRAIDAAKPYVARGLCYASAVWLPDWSEQDLADFRSKYNYYKHFSADHDLATLVPDHFVPRKAVVGTPDECVETLARLSKSGFTKISLTPMGDVTQCLKLLGEKVLPKL
jgi:5,10-methylenetetrahydromethanopterin reductase